MESAVITSPSNPGYDRVPYESHPFSQSHPDRLATLAKLFGMKPAEVSKCRVLELGCASGGNLIPVAASLPESSFVGVDLSKVQIEAGQAMVDALGLKNIELKQISIDSINADFGKFDYIICHGVYSWVPEEVQEAILRICNENLADHGIAYISYNIFPGWRFRSVVRDLMLFHTGQFNDPASKAAQARAALDFLAKSVPAENNAYGLMLRTELEYLSQKKDYYLLHEYLEDANHPVYLYQFNERAQKHGLQFLAEADFAVMLPSNFDQKVSDTLQRISNEIVRTEQYMDFVRNRAFRQTLVCHSKVPLKRHLDHNSVTSFYISANVTPITENINPKTTEAAQFSAPGNLTITSTNPIMKAALLELGKAWPQSIHFADLLGKATEQVLGSGADKASVGTASVNLGAELLTLYCKALVNFRSEKPPFTTELSEKPEVSGVARYQAGTGSLILTNQLHEIISSDTFGQNLIAFCDGKNDKKAIVEKLAARIKDGGLNLQKGGKQISEDAEIKEIITPLVNDTLERMLKAALLVS